MENILKSLRVITRPSEAGPGELAKAIRALDETLQDSDGELDGRLRHFLENRSYEKALVWLQGEEPEKGICGG